MAEKNETNFFSSQDAPWERRIASVLKVIAYVGMAAVLAMMIITVIHAGGRYAFNSPLRGNVEISSILLVFVIFFTGAYTQVAKRHVSIGLIVDRLSERTQAVIDSITYILCLAMAVVASWQAVVKGIDIMESGTLTAVLNISHFPLLFVIAFGWAIFGLAVLMQLIHSLPKAIRGLRR